MPLTIPDNDEVTDISQAAWMQTDIDALVSGIGGDGVLSGGAVSPQGSPNMTVAVAAGVDQIAGIPVTYTAGNLTIGAAHATLNRIDIITVSNAGVKTVTAGTAAANAKTPPVPAGHVLHARVDIPAAVTSIPLAQIIDKRVIVPEYPSINIKQRGAVGDGTTDNATVLDAIVTEINAAGGGYLVIPRGTYLHNGTGGMQFTTGNVTIDAQRGAIFSFPNLASDEVTATSGRAGIRFRGTGGTNTTTVAASILQGAVSFVVASATGFAAGKWLVVRSSGEIFNSDRETKYFNAEWAQIRAVSGTTITLDKPLNLGYSNAFTITVEVFTLLQNISVRGLTVLGAGVAGALPSDPDLLPGGGAGPGTSNSQIGYRFEFCESVLVDTCTVLNCERYGFQAIDCVKVEYRNCRARETNEVALGYGFRSTACFSVVYFSCRGERNRHSYDDDSYVGHALTHDITLIGCRASSDWGAGFSTHGGTNRTTVLGAHVAGCGGGMVFRGRETVLDGFHIYGTHNLATESYYHGILFGDGLSVGTSLPGMGEAGRRLTIANGTIDLMFSNAAVIADGIRFNSSINGCVIENVNIFNVTGHGINALGFQVRDLRIMNSLIDGSRQGATAHGVLIAADTRTTNLPAGAPSTTDGRNQIGVMITGNTFKGMYTSAIKIVGNGAVTGGNLSRQIQIRENMFTSYAVGGSGSAIDLSSGFFGSDIAIDKNTSPAGTLANFFAALTLSNWPNGAPDIDDSFIAGVRYTKEWVWSPAQQGLLAANYDPLLLNTPTVLTGGVISLSKVFVPKTISVTNIIHHIGTAGSTLTTAQNWIGIFDSAGNRLGVSADQTTAWGSSGTKTAAIAGGPITINGGPGVFVWVAFLSNGTTPAAPQRVSNNAAAVNIGLAASVSRFGTILTGQTTLPTTITPGSITQDGKSYWAALS